MLCVEKNRFPTHYVRFYSTYDTYYSQITKKYENFHKRLSIFPKSTWNLPFLSLHEIYHKSRSRLILCVPVLNPVKTHKMCLCFAVLCILDFDWFSAQCERIKTENKQIIYKQKNKDSGFTESQSYES